ncbi:TonB family protein [Alteromonadaceae bacterium BrNp21-10]|nr:TonB family protein [Alteromonadaceae bacterium BrNp21-10]
MPNTLQLPSLPLNLQVASKALVFSVIASGITFMLFVLMQYLVKPATFTHVDPIPYQIIDPVFAREDTPVQPNRILPVQPKTVTPPKLTPDLEDPSDNNPLTNFNAGPVIPPSTIGSQSLPTFTMGDTEAKPMVRVEPKYPITAARDGIEGWVQLRFDITPTGRVENVQIVEAEPARVFNQEAKRALSRWKYQPKIINGVAQSQQNQNVMLSFKLGQ